MLYRRVVFSFVAAVGTVTTTQLGLSVPPPARYLMWLTCLRVCVLVGFATWHAVEVTGGALWHGHLLQTLDLVLLPSMTEAVVHDWKSYYQIIAPDTFQSKFYPLLLMCLNPSLQRVRFVLEFIRYGASRSVEYTRQDVSWLKELAERERTRQQKLHKTTARGTENHKAFPGRHCTWCPLLLAGCPVAKANPYAQMTAEERLRFALWLQEAEKQNTRVLRSMMVEQGPIRYRDENQNEYLADFVPVEKRFYPYEDTAMILQEWLRSHPEDAGFVEKLTVSGLSSPLEAKKRAELAAKLVRLADVRVDTELRIGRGKRNGCSQSCFACDGTSQNNLRMCQHHGREQS